MRIAEYVIAAAIFVILAILIVGAIKNADDFRSVCDKAGGTTIYDGRQWQCITPMKATP